MRKSSLRILTICTVCAVTFSGCGLMAGKEAAEPLPAESSVAEVVIDPEEQARLDLLDSLDDVSIPTTTETRRKENTSISASREEGTEESGEGAERDVLIPGAWLSDDETKQEFISEDDSMQLAVPLDWRDLRGVITSDDEINQSFTVQIGNTDQALFFMSNSESRRYSPFMSLDEYSSAIVAAVYNSMNSSEAFTDPQLLETVDIDSAVNDFVIRKSTIQAGYEGNPILYYIYAVQGSYRYFQFNCWTAESQKDAAEAVFDEIVTRFYEQ